MNSINLTITTTAMPVPELLYTTLESFSSKMKNCVFKTHIMNIDPIFSLITDSKIDLMARISSIFFEESFIFVPKKCNFAAAVKRVWSAVESEYFFNLEYDWIALEEIDCLEFIDKLESEKNKVKNNKNKSIQNISCRAYKNLKHESHLTPGFFINDEKMKRFCKSIDMGMNPEWQLSRAKFRGVHYPDRVVVKDIGREWQKKNYFKRNGDSRTFNTWLNS